MMGDMGAGYLGEWRYKIRSLFIMLAAAITSVGRALTGGRLQVQQVRSAMAMAALVLFSWVAGRATATDGELRKGLLTLAVIVVVAIVGRILLGNRLKPGFASIELAVVLLLLSTLILRRRTSDELAYNPLDPAAQLRVLCVLLAAMLAGAALLSPKLPGARRRPELTSLPVRIYMLYVLVAIIGAVFSVSPFLTLYRSVELVTALAVVAGAYWVAGQDATGRIEAACYWFLVALVASVWIGAAISPGSALIKPRTSPLPVQLVGVLPAMAANTVGARGMMLAVWSFARLVAQRRTGRRHRLALPMFLIGVITLVLAQYRTGYVAFIVGVAVVLGMRRRAVMVAGVLVVTAIIVWAPSVVETTEPYALRGQSTEEARGLSSRFDWWHDAIPVWKESPIIGRGLLTASRFEVLAVHGRKETSAIHSTWVEALVGTGVVGAGLLVSSVLITLSRARRAAGSKTGGSILPLALLAVLLVRSITANALESFSFDFFLFLVIAISLPSHPVDSGPAGEGRPGVKTGGVAPPHPSRPALPVPPAGP